MSEVLKVCQETKVCLECQKYSRPSSAMLCFYCNKYVCYDSTPPLDGIGPRLHKHFACNNWHSIVLCRGYGSRCEKCEHDKCGGDCS